jgi:hypothetical protein
VIDAGDCAVILTALPLTVTDTEGEKSEPVSVRLIAPDPARTLVGEREVSTGTNWVTGTFNAALLPPAGGGLTVIETVADLIAQNLAKRGKLGQFYDLRGDSLFELVS